MDVRFGPGARAIIAGGAAAAVLIAAYAFGSAQAGRTPTAYAAATTPAASAVAAKITVTGAGTASGTPDQLVVQLGVQTHGTSVTSTLGQANQAVDRIRSALRSYGVRDKDLQTAGLSVQPSYAGGGSVPNGYDVSEALTARLHKLASAGGAISAASRAGGDATRIDGVSFDMGSTSAVAASARAAAMTDATNKARQYARAAGRTLGSVVSIQEATTPPPLVFGTSATAGDARAGVPISPGTQQLSVTLTVVFTLA